MYFTYFNRKKKDFIRFTLYYPIVHCVIRVSYGARNVSHGARKVLHSVRKMLHGARLFTIVYCQLSIVNCLLSTVYCLLSTDSFKQTRHLHAVNTTADSYILFRQLENVGPIKHLALFLAQSLDIPNLKGYQNTIIGYKAKSFLMNGWILPIALH